MDSKNDNSFDLEVLRFSQTDVKEFLDKFISDEVIVEPSVSDLDQETSSQIFDYENNQCLMCSYTGDMDVDLQNCLDNCEIDIYVDFEELNIPVYSISGGADFVEEFMFYHDKIKFYSKVHSWIDEEKLREQFMDCKEYSLKRTLCDEFKICDEPCFKSCSTPYDNMVQIHTNRGSKAICKICDSVFYQVYLRLPFESNLKVEQRSTCGGLVDLPEASNLEITSGVECDLACVETGHLHKYCCSTVRREIIPSLKAIASEGSPFQKDTRSTGQCSRIRSASLNLATKTKMKNDVNSIDGKLGFSDVMKLKGDLMALILSPSFKFRTDQFKHGIIVRLLRENEIKDICLRTFECSTRKEISFYQIRCLYNLLKQHVCDKQSLRMVEDAYHICLRAQFVKNGCKDVDKHLRFIFCNLSHFVKTSKIRAQSLFSIDMNHRSETLEKLNHTLSDFLDKSFMSSGGNSNVKGDILGLIMVLIKMCSSASLADKLFVLTLYLTRFENCFIKYFEWMSCSIQDYAQALAQVLQRPSRIVDDKVRAQIKEDVECFSHVLPEVVENCDSKIQSVYSKCKDGFSSFQSYIKNECESEHTTDLGRKIIKGTMGIIASILSVDIPNRDISLSKKFTQSLTNISKSVKTVDNIWKFIESVFDESITSLLVLCGLVKPEDTIAQINNKIIPWMQEVDRMCDNKFDVEIGIDHTIAERAADLLRKGREYETELQEKQVSHLVMTEFNNKLSTLKPYVRQIAPHYYNDSVRRTPFVIALFGEPGCGKSTMRPYAVADLMRGMFDHEDFDIKYDPCRHDYSMNLTRDHWDGYHNQPVVIGDDFMQSRDTQDIIKSMVEMIHMVNTEPYPLKMADLKEKGNTRFTSRLIMLSSNHRFCEEGAYAGNRPIEAPEAFCRRIHMRADISVRPEYRLDGTSRVDCSKLDPDRTFNHQIYQIDYELVPAENRTHHPNGGTVDYSGFIQICLDVWKAMYANDKKHIEGAKNWEGTQSTGMRLVRCGLESKWVPVKPVKAQMLSSVKSYVSNKFGEVKSGLSKYENTLIYCRLKIENALYPCSEWSQKMKDEFYRLKDKCSQSVDTGYYEWFKQLVSNIRFDFIKEHPWYAAACILLSTFGVVSLISSFFSNADGQDNASSEYQRSGDQKTNRYVRRFERNNASEVMSSGDQRTARYVKRFDNPRYISEAVSSGDQKTSRYVRRFDRNHQSEYQSSGDQKTSRYVKRFNRDKISSEAFDRELYDGVLFDPSDAPAIAQRSSDPQTDSLLRHKLYNNIARVHMKYGTTNGLFICDTILMIPGHLASVLEDGETFIVTTHRSTQKYNEKDCHWIKDDENDQCDTCFVQLPNYDGYYPSILDDFHSFDDLQKSGVPRQIVLGGTVISDKFMPYTQLGYHVIEKGPVKYQVGADDDPDKYDQQTLNCLEYYAPTEQGDCGAPVLAINRQIQRKIMGIHVAGNNEIGYCNILDKEYVKKQVSKFQGVIKAKMQILSDEPFGPHSSFIEADRDCVDICGQVNKCDQFRNPGKTSIKPSLLHGIFPVQTSPAMLAPKDGIDPLRLAIATQFVGQIVFPQAYVNIAVEDMIVGFRSYESGYENKGLLSEHEIINGVNGDPWIRPMNKKTSAGFPYIHAKKNSNKIGKFDFLDGEDGAYTYGSFLRRKVNEREQMAINGEIPSDTLFCDSFKDERRPLEKVAQGKTRVFNTAPFDLNVLVRKYFGSFIAHMMSNHIKGECSVGIDPHSDSWEELYRDLDNFAPNWIAGDFSKYDKTLSFQAIMGALDVINSWYGDGEQNQFVRKVLFVTMFNASHLAGRVVYRVRQGNPSGIPLTVIINSLVNSMFSRIMFVAIGKEKGHRCDMNWFHKNVKIKNYGDDNIGKVSHACDWYNMISLRDCFKSYGITYTNPAKTGVESCFLPEDEVSYLKRKFRKDGIRVWAPLDMTSIQEMVMWTRDGPLSPQDSVDRTFESAVREMVHYGKLEFVKFQTYVLQEAAKRGVRLGGFVFEDLRGEMTDKLIKSPFFLSSEKKVTKTKNQYLTDDDLLSKDRDFEGKAKDVELVYDKCVKKNKNRAQIKIIFSSSSGRKRFPRKVESTVQFHNEKEMEAQFYTSERLYYTAILQMEEPDDDGDIYAMLADCHGIWLRFITQKELDDPTFIDVTKEIIVCRRNLKFILLDSSTGRVIDNLTNWMKQHYDSVLDERLEAQFITNNDHNSFIDYVNLKLSIFLKRNKDIDSEDMEIVRHEVLKNCASGYSCVLYAEHIRKMIYTVTDRRELRLARLEGLICDYILYSCIEREDPEKKLVAQFKSCGDQGFSWSYILDREVIDDRYTLTVMDTHGQRVLRMNRIGYLKLKSDYATIDLTMKKNLTEFEENLLYNYKEQKFYKLLLQEEERKRDESNRLEAQSSFVKNESLGFIERLKINCLIGYSYLSQIFSRF